MSLPRTKYLPRVKYRRPLEADTGPRLVGVGATRFSTSVAVEPWPPMFRLDSNGYYRDLGVLATASRIEIKQAYLQRNGHFSWRLTFVVKQLLDPEVRRRYDAVPPGHIFFDAWLAAIVKQRLIAEAPPPPSSDSVPSSAGDPLEEAFADLRHEVFPPVQAQRHQHWAWYEWGVAYDAGVPALLSEWRTALVAAAAERGIVTSLAVGIMADLGVTPAMAINVGNVLVAFIAYGVIPSASIATAVIDRLSN